MDCSGDAETGGICPACRWNVLLALGFGIVIVWGVGWRLGRAQGWGLGNSSFGGWLSCCQGFSAFECWFN